MSAFFSSARCCCHRRAPRRCRRWRRSGSGGRRSRTAARSTLTMRSASTAAARGPSSRPQRCSANSSPPSRATRSLSRAGAQAPRRRLLQHRIAHGVPERVVDVLEMVEIDAQHRRPSRRARYAGSSRAISSENCMRLGRPVSASCRARCRTRASVLPRSVTSSCVDTHPPSFIGWWCIEMVRPSSSSCTFLP